MHSCWKNVCVVSDQCFLCRLILTSLYAPTKIPATSGGPMVDFEYKQMSDGNQHGNSLLLCETKKKRRKETK